MSERNIQCLVPGILAMAVNTDVAYYRLINDAAQRQFGARPNSLRIVLHKIDFAAFVDAIRDGAPARAQVLIAQGLEQLRSGGADFAVVTANAAGVMAERPSSEFGLPFANGATGIQTHQEIIELNYDIHVAQGVNFEPDFQYYFRPNGQSNIKDAALLGFKSHINF